MGAFLTSKTALAVTNPLPNPVDPAMAPGVEAWKYIKVDPQAVADRAYEDYPIGHCMHTVFMSIVSEVADALETSDPLAARTMRAFPFHMFHYGSSGGNGLGSLCGALNGAMAAINLFVGSDKMRKAITQELVFFYERAELPLYEPKGAEGTHFPKTISNSVLCHISSGKWCELAQARSESPERTERCARLSADVARKTIELLNLNFAGLNSADFEPIVSLEGTDGHVRLLSRQGRRDG